MNWNPDILKTAFTDAVWDEIAAEIAAARGAPANREETVAFVANLSWYVVTSAVSSGFGGVPRERLLKAVRMAAAG